MSTTIRLPQFAETVVEGVVGKWLKDEGEWVKEEEPLVEIVTDKVTIEMTSPAEGRLARIIAAEGAVVPVEGALAVFDEVAGEKSAPLQSHTAETREPEDVDLDVEIPGGWRRPRVSDRTAAGESVGTGVLQCRKAQLRPGLVLTCAVLAPVPKAKRKLGSNESTPKSSHDR